MMGAGRFGFLAGSGGGAIPATSVGRQGHRIPQPAVAAAAQRHPGSEPRPARATLYGRRSSGTPLGVREVSLHVAPWLLLRSNPGLCN